MKKFCFSRLSCLLFILLSLVFAGCENFLAGDLIQEQVQRLIDEANAPEVEIYIAADADTGSVAPNGIVTYKVGKTFPVIFTEGKGYQFSHWEVLDKETKSVLNGPITISDAYSPEIRVSVNSIASNIYLKPVCIERPGISQVSPQYLETGVSRDSSISIAFNKNISKDNDFSKIQITSGGISVKDCYKAPVVNNNILIFAANPANLVEVTSGTKTITVTIPADFFYIDDKSVVTLGTEYSWSFKVNNTTDAKTEITFSATSDIGKISPEGQNIKYNIGETINLKFEPKDEYKFVGWNVIYSDQNNTEAALDITEPVYDASSNVYKSVITVKSKVAGCSITPKGTIIPVITNVYPPDTNTMIKCDTPLVITFSLDMTEEDFTSFSKIKIVNKYNEDITSYFKTPVYSNKKLILKPDSSKITDIFGTDSTTSITITLLKNITDLMNKNQIGEDYSFTAKLSNERGKDSPEFISLNIRKTNTIDSGLSEKSYYDNEINKNRIWTEEDYNTNHVKSLWISCAIKAPESGFNNKLKITETLIEKTDGSNVNEVAEVYNYTNFIDKGNDIFESVPFEYSFKSMRDGVVKIDFEISDYANNTTVKTYYVVKDTSVNVDSELSIYNIVPIPEYGLQDVNTTREDLINHVKRIYINKLIDDAWAYNRKTDTTSLISNNLVKLKWSADPENLIYEDYFKYNSTEDKFYCDLFNINETETTYLQLEVSDMAGNKHTYNTVILPKPTIYTVRGGDGADNYVYFTPTGNNQKFQNWMDYGYYNRTFYSEDGIIFTKSSYSSYPYNTPSRLYNRSELKKMIIVPVHYILGYMTGEVITYGFPTDVYDLSSADLVSEEIPISMDWTLEIKESDVDGEGIINITIPSDTRNAYDNMMIDFWGKPYEVKENTIKITWESEDLYDRDVSVSLYGFKDNKIYIDEKTEYNVAIDNLGPKIEHCMLYNKNGRSVTFLTPKDPNGLQVINGKTPVTIYYTSWRANWPFVLDSSDSTKINLTSSEIKAFDHFDILIDPNKTEFTVDMPDLEDGSYLICMSVKDGNGYETCDKVSKYYVGRLKTPVVSYSSSTTITAEVVGDNGMAQSRNSGVWEGFYQYYTLEVFNKSTNKWETVKDSEKFYNNEKVGETLNYLHGNVGDKNSKSFSLSDLNNHTTSFARFTLKECFLRTKDSWSNTSGNEYLAPYFIYETRFSEPVYFTTKMQGIGDRYSGVLMKDNNGYTLLTGTYGKDTRGFVHIVYSKTNYGSSNPSEWERRTNDDQQINPRVLAPYETYPISMENDVPSRNWYTIILHCDDGSIKMTEPVYKR